MGPGFTIDRINFDEVETSLGREVAVQLCVTDMAIGIGLELGLDYGELVLQHCEGNLNFMSLPEILLVTHWSVRTTPYYVSRSLGLLHHCNRDTPRRVSELHGAVDIETEQLKQSSPLLASVTV